MLKAILHTRPARQLDTIFTSADLQRLGNTVEVIWGKDEQMPEEAWTEAKKEASILIGIPSYGIGDVDENAAPHLKTIMEVGGAHPRKESVDYQTCFRRNIRVLSCAPAFAKMVVEMALGHALAALRMKQYLDVDIWQPKNTTIPTTPNPRNSINPRQSAIQSAFQQTIAECKFNSYSVNLTPHILLQLRCWKQQCGKQEKMAHICGHRRSSLERPKLIRPIKDGYGETKVEYL